MLSRFSKLSRQNILKTSTIKTTPKFFTTSTQSAIDDPLMKKVIQGSQKGRSLAWNVTQTQPLDAMERKQRYQIFINKMHQLYRSEKYHARKLRASSKKMRLSHVQYQNPLIETLSQYNKLSVNGFDGKVVAQSLENLDLVLQAQGNKPISMTDYTVAEMDQSWRMYKLAEDLKFGLSNSQAWFSPQDMARSSLALAKIGYKNTEVQSMWLAHLQNRLQDDNKTKYVSPPTFEHQVYGSFKNFDPRYYIYQGFQDSEEFQQHLNTLLMFKKENRNKNQKNLDKLSSVQQIEKSIEAVIQAAKEVKNFQKEQQATFETLRRQFYALQQASNKHEFLQQNKYITYDLLELQELLVKGGYLSPNEALEGAQESIEDQMERASEVFHDIVLNHQPELLSPQIEQYYDASVGEQELEKPLFENNHDLSLGSLSDILVGLSQQALSFRRDACDRDYPNEFYEKLLMPEEQRPTASQNMSQTEKFQNQDKQNIVLMERSYLNPWTTFTKHSRAIIDQHFPEMVEQTNSPDELLKGLRALVECRLEAKEIRQKITQKLNSLLTSNEQVSVQALIDGAYGLAGVWTQPQNGGKLAKQIVRHLNSKRAREFTMNQKIDLLHALAILSSRYPQVLQSAAFKNNLTALDSIVYQMVDNDLTYKQYNQLLLVHQTLDHFGQENFTNSQLVAAFKQPDFIQRYEEAHVANYDPLKNRVVQGLTQGMTTAELKLMHTLQDYNLFAADLKIKPDVLAGVKGEQLALYVLNNKDVLHDTLEADGTQQHLMSLTKSKLKNVPIALDRIVEYDLQNFHLKLKDDFNLEKIVGKQEKKDWMEGFLTFSYNYTQNFNSDKMTGNVDAFVDELVKFYQLKTRADLVHEPEQRLNANDELKVALIKLKMIHDTSLTQFEKEQVQQAISHGKRNRSFKELISQMKSSLCSEGAQIKKECSSKVDSLFNFEWQGVRQSVELPTSAKGTKDIFPELLSTKWAKHGSYHHYSDWKAMMQQTYDQFNLLEVDPKVPVKVNFDAVDRYRKVPKGIYPHPERKRIVMQQPSGNTEKASLATEMAKFEKDPYEYMIKKEIELSSQLNDITPEVSLITNLQNLKYSLLSDHSDQSIFENLLFKLDFTDALIPEHLSQSQTTQSAKPKYLPRDPSAFRDYMSSKPETQSMYTQFYLKEALKQQKPKKLFDEINQLVKEGKEVPLSLQDELDRVILELSKENEDPVALSDAIKTYINIKTDLDKLGVLDQVTKSKQNTSISDTEYLRQERCRAESTLIKTKILAKLHNDIFLSEAEQQYLQEWKKEMAKSETLIKDCLVPNKPTKLSIKDLSQNDFTTFNNLTLVQLNSSQHGHFALSDLLLELSQVFDHQSTRDVEISCLQELIGQKWQLSKDFKLVTRRNRQIDIITEELEELAFRTAGQFNQKEKEAIKNVFNVGRGADFYDKAFKATDDLSLDQFLDDVQPYDNRIEMLEMWLARKEQELKQRVNFVTPELQQSDKAIYQQISPKYDRARQKLVSDIFVSDTQKKYSELTKEDLHQMVEAICPRLNLFGRDYPNFMPQAVRGIMEHPNLNRSDRAILDSYAKMFKLDWRGDQSIDAKDEFMCTHPIYLSEQDQSSIGSIGTLDLNQTLKEACQPFLPALVKRILIY